MKTIYKYQLKTTELQTIEIPEGCQILCLQVQNNIPCIWALVDPSAPLKKYHFETFGTGHPLPDANRYYMGTYQLNSGLVFHCFEILSL